MIERRKWTATAEGCIETMAGVAQDIASVQEKFGRRFEPTDRERLRNLCGSLLAVINELVQIISEEYPDLYIPRVLKDIQVEPKWTAEVIIPFPEGLFWYEKVQTYMGRLRDRDNGIKSLFDEMVAKGKLRFRADKNVNVN